MVKGRFVLIDAFALIYRAYYALPPSLTADGHPVQAAYGFASALLSAIRILQPEYLAVGMDKGKSHRIKSFEAYKIHRKPTPGDLISQLPYVVDILKTMNIPYFAVPGFEGEDVIATIVHKVKSQKLKVAGNIEYIIVTGDLDLLQLVDENIKVYSMARGVNQAVMYDRAKVIERYGLTPAQFVDFKALKGDPSDNIPGVKGIGEKGAAKLIIEYKNLDNIYQNIELIKGKVQTLLKDNKETAYLSQKLSKITAEAPLDFTLSDARIHQYDKEKTIALFRKLGFKSLIDRLPREEQKEPQPRLF